MKFYQMVSPKDKTYAEFGRRGTWEPAQDAELCDECTGSNEERVPPLVIEWSEGSDLIGDFVWGGFNSELVARKSIASMLKEKCLGFTLCDLQMIESKRKKKIVTLPYDGPEIVELWIDTWCYLDEKKSNVTMEQECSTCGIKYYKPKRQGLVLAETSRIQENSMFRLHQFPGGMFCGEGVKNFIEEKGFNNIAFMDVTNP